MYSYVNIHTHHLGEGINILDIGEGKVCLEEIGVQQPGESREVYYSVGIHPMKIGQIGKDDLAVIHETVHSETVIAIGECGLDRRSEISIREQEEVLMDQVRLAEETRKPLIIHCVKAYSDLISVRKKSKSTVPWIVHGFNNNEQILNQLLEHGFYISIGAALLNPQSNAFHLIRKIPLEALFLENDDEMVEIGIIYEAASCMLGIDVKGLRRILKENYNKIFNK